MGVLGVDILAITIITTEIIKLTMDKTINKRITIAVAARAA